MTTPQLSPSQLAGGFYGLLLGDAVGVPYEFHYPNNLPPLDQLDMIPPSDFPRAHRRVPTGTWSDDGALALALLDSLLDCGQFDAEDFGRRLIDWYEHGRYAVDQVVFDVGIQTAESIRFIKQKIPSLYAGGVTERSNGNGSLMRALACVLWHRGSDDALITLADQQSRVTHSHIRSRVCCALYCVWARYVAAGDLDAWTTAVRVVREHYQHNETATAELEFHIRPEDDIIGTGSGYVVDSLRSAKQVFDQQQDLKRSIQAAIALGHDTDTTACIAGGVVGLRVGQAGLPIEWMQQLRGLEICEPIFKKLVAHQTKPTR